MTWDYRDRAHDEFSLQASEDDARAFPDDVVTAPQPAPVVREKRTTFQERHDAFIADGLCPACKIELDDSGFCSICGFDVAKDSAPMTIELRDDYIPQLPLPIDEFAPAAVTDEAA